MSNYTSKRIDYGKPDQLINIPLIYQVLQTKQRKYDANEALIQNTLDSYGNIGSRIYKDVDKEYLANRLQQVTNVINTAGGSHDLSRNGIARNLMSQIKTVASDPIVLNAIEQSTKLDNYNKVYSQLKPEQQSDVNYAYGLEKSGAKAYMEDTTGAINKFGNLQYTPYEDIQPLLAEYAKNLDKYAEVVKENTPQGMYFVNKEGKRLTQSQIQNQISTLLSDKQRNQMRINGWNNYERNVSPDITVEEFTKFTNRKVANIDGEIANTQTQLANSTDDAEKNNLNNYLTGLTQQKSEVQDQYNKRITKQDTGNMAAEMEYDNTIGGFARVFAFNDVGTTYTVNSVAVDEMKLQFKSLTGTTPKVDANNDGIEDVRNVPLPYQGETTNFLNDEEKRAKEFDTTYKGNLSNEYEKLPQFAKDNFQKVLQEYPKADKEDLMFRFMKKLAQGSSNLVSKGVISSIEDVKLKAETYQKNYVDTVNTAAAEIEEEVLPNIINGYSANPNIIVLDSRGVAVSGSEYLEKNGIKTTADLNTPAGKKVKEQLLKSYYADQILSNGNIVDEIMNSSFSERFTGVSFKKPTEEVSALSAALRQKFSTEKEYNDFLNLAKSKGVYDTNKTVDFLTNKLAVLGSNLLNRDNSVEDDRGMRSLITPDKIKERAATLIGQNKITTRDAGIEVQTGTPYHNELISAVGSEFRAEDGSLFIANKTSDITIRPISPDEVEVSQVRTPTEKDPRTKQTAKMLIQNLPQSVLQKVSFAGIGKTFTASNIPEIFADAKYYSENDVRTIRDLGTSVLNSQEEAYNLSKEEVTRQLFSPIYKNITGSAAQPTPMGAVIQNVIENPNKLPPLQVGLIKDNNDVFLTVKYKKGNQEKTIYTFKAPIPEDRLDAVYKEVNYAPQKYTNAILSLMVQQQATNPTAPNYIFNSLQEVYAQ